MDEDKPRIDLHPSEWKRTGHRQPFFGPAAPYFIIMFLAAFPVSAFATWVVTGEWPYWLQHFLQ